MNSYSNQIRVYTALKYELARLVKLPAKSIANKITIRSFGCNEMTKWKTNKKIQEKWREKRYLVWFIIFIQVNEGINTQRLNIILNSHLINNKSAPWKHSDIQYFTFNSNNSANSAFSYIWVEYLVNIINIKPLMRAFIHQHKFLSLTLSPSLSLSLSLYLSLFLWNSVVSVSDVVIVVCTFDSLNGEMICFNRMFSYTTSDTTAILGTYSLCFHFFLFRFLIILSLSVHHLNDGQRHLSAKKTVNQWESSILGHVNIG